MPPFPSEQIQELLDKVHDCWFDLDRIHYDRNTRLVRLPLSQRRPGTRASFQPDFALVVDGVGALSVDDTERIGIYDLNEIIYDASRRELIITGGIPIRIVMAVDRLALRLLPAQQADGGAGPKVTGQ